MISIKANESNNGQANEAILELSDEVEAALMKYRKKIIDFKYGHLKKGVKLSRLLDECLGEYLTMGSFQLKKLRNRIRS